MISTRTPRMSRRPATLSREEHGVALVLVLWMLMLLIVVANSVALTARTEVQVAGNQFALARAEAVADAAIHKAIAELLAPPNDVGRWRGDGLDRLWSFDAADVRVTIRAEAAKVDLNAAPATLLAGLFRAVGIAPQDAARLADAVADWRDPDDLRSLHGAERPEYAAAGKADGPANVPFDSVEELRLVLGIDAEIFRAVSGLVTVYTQSAEVNTATAERLVLLALPGAVPEQVDAYLEQRRFALERGLPPPPFGQVSGAPGSNDGLYAIRAEANLGDNARFSREAVVHLTGDASRPYVILAWRAVWSDAPEAADAAAAL